YEDVYLKKYESVQDLLIGLTHYFLFYNEERRHQSLDYQTPDVVYRTATGGGAKIVDKFGGALKTSSSVERSATGDDVSGAKELGAAPCSWCVSRALS
ncbi:MAG: transposase, partial [Glaciimonas sp.]|nr:transposase [Glaciimonas sp.]